MKVSIDQLALEISAEADMSKKDAKAFTQFIFGVLAENLSRGDEVNIPSFGKFKVRETAARQGRNPKTGETIDIPAKKAVKFLPAKQLKEEVGGDGT